MLVKTDDTNMQIGMLLKYATMQLDGEGTNYK